MSIRRKLGLGALVLTAVVATITYTVRNMGEEVYRGDDR